MPLLEQVAQLSESDRATP